METEERMSPSQWYLFEKATALSCKNKEVAMRKLKLSSDQQSAFEEARKRLEDARIVVSLNLHEHVFKGPMIKSLLSSRRLYNIFEIAHAERANNPSRMRLRIMLEFKMYGGNNDVQNILSGMSNTEHPNYGILDYLHNPVGISMLGNYGWYRFGLEYDVKKRSTYAPKDSLYIQPGQLFVWDDVDGLLATQPIKGGRRWFEYISQKQVPIDGNGNAYYIEAEPLGGIFIRKDGDVEDLHYPETDQFNTEFFEELKKFDTEFGIDLKPY
jgi:hypothetical protein